MWTRVWVSGMSFRQWYWTQKRQETRVSFLPSWLEKQGHFWNCTFWGSFPPKLPNQFLSPIFSDKTNQNSLLNKPRTAWTVLDLPLTSKEFIAFSTNYILELSKIARNSMLSETRNLCSYRESLTLIPWSLPLLSYQLIPSGMKAPDFQNYWDAMAETNFYYYLLFMLMLETIFCWLNLGIVYLRVTVYLSKMSDFIQHYYITPLNVFSQYYFT